MERQTPSTGGYWWENWLKLQCLNHLFRFSRIPGARAFPNAICHSPPSMQSFQSTPCCSTQKHPMVYSCLFPHLHWQPKILECTPPEQLIKNERSWGKTRLVSFCSSPKCTTLQYILASIYLFTTHFASFLSSWSTGKRERLRGCERCCETIGKDVLHPKENDSTESIASSPNLN